MSAANAYEEARAKLEFEVARLALNISRYQAGTEKRSLNYGHAGSTEHIAHQIRMINETLEDWNKP